MTCFKCLSKGHTVHECTISDKQVPQRNLEGILAARGAPAVNATLGEHRGPACLISILKDWLVNPYRKGHTNDMLHMYYICL